MLCSEKEYNTVFDLDSQLMGTGNASVEPRVTACLLRPIRRQLEYCMLRPDRRQLGLQCGLWAGARKNASRAVAVAAVGSRTLRSAL